MPIEKMSSSLGIVGLRAALRGEQQLLVAGHRFLERLQRLVAADEQRHDHVREHDDVAQREQRKPIATPWSSDFIVAIL